MSNTNSGARKHRHRKFRDHWHIDRDAVALLESKTFQHIGELLHLFKKVGIGDGAHIAWFAFPVIRNAIADAIGDMTVEAILRNVQGSTDEPLRKREFPFKSGCKIGVPREKFASLTRPECFVISIGLAIERIVRRQRVRLELGRRRKQPVLVEIVLNRRFSHDTPRKRWATARPWRC
ncbi:unannotated protein [freshwater metagenome]|uniref:Unannotated protein n=1 Tax=freshwater metagenome TaxID=449393 RepID=A0A6J6S3B6_9ZZZZ